MVNMPGLSVTLLYFGHFRPINPNTETHLLSPILFQLLCVADVAQLRDPKSSKRMNLSTFCRDLHTSICSYSLIT